MAMKNCKQIILGKKLFGGYKSVSSMDAQGILNFVSFVIHIIFILLCLIYVLLQYFHTLFVTFA